MGIACRAWAAYPSDHPNVTRAVDAAQARVGEMLSAHGSVAIGVAKKHLRVGVWTLESAQARALAQALYQRQVAVLRIDRGLQPEEFRALVLWLAGPAVPLEPGSAPAGPPTLPSARHVHLQPLDYSAVRLTDKSSETTAQPGVVSLTDRLLNVVLEWGTPGDADWDWESDQPATGAAVPAEVAMVGWLRKFLKEQAAREQAERAAAEAVGTQTGESGSPGSGTGGSGSGSGRRRRRAGARARRSGRRRGHGRRAERRHARPRRRQHGPPGSARAHRRARAGPDRRPGRCCRPAWRGRQRSAVAHGARHRRGPGRGRRNGHWTALPLRRPIRRRTAAGRRG